MGEVTETQLRMYHTDSRCQDENLVFTINRGRIRKILGFIFYLILLFLLDTCYVKSKKEVLPAVCLLLSPRLLNCSSLQEIRPLLAKPGHTSHCLVEKDEVENDTVTNI